MGLWGSLGIPTAQGRAMGADLCLLILPGKRTTWNVHGWGTQTRSAIPLCMLHSISFSSSLRHFGKPHWTPQCKVTTFIVQKFKVFAKPRRGSHTPRLSPIPATGEITQPMGFRCSPSRLRRVHNSKPKRNLQQCKSPFYYIDICMCLFFLWYSLLLPCTIAINKWQRDA